MAEFADINCSVYRIPMVRGGAVGSGSQSGCRLERARFEIRAGPLSPSGAFVGDRPSGARRDAAATGHAGPSRPHPHRPTFLPV